MLRKLLIIIIVIFITIPAYAKENTFVNCKECRSIIERSYEANKISGVEKVIFELFLTYNPEKVPVKYRCSDHRLYPSDISSIIEYPEGYIGEEMVIEGLFMGWKGAPGTPPVTRSDWVISNGIDSIYVTGGFPMGLNPVEAEDIGTEISIQGIIRKINFDDQIVYFIELLNPRAGLTLSN